jgi:AmmeMemoRadiSam system protein B
MVRVHKPMDTDDGGRAPRRCVRRPAVAGTFYPASSAKLSHTVTELLAAAPVPRDPRSAKAVIVPHAGYAYSGAVAAAGYAAVKNATPKRVVLIGPAHFVAVHGLAATSADWFETPLGRVHVDRDACEQALEEQGVAIRDDAHGREHSLEVQLPFLQVLFGHFSLVPLVAGACSGETVARVLAALWGGPETLVVISSDLSHYHDYETALVLDQKTARDVEGLRAERLGPDSACGRVPVAGLLLEAGRRGLRGERLALANSGDSAGPRDRVVGYGAWAFYPSVCGLD